jgi:Protein of unknown function, DUF488
VVQKETIVRAAAGRFQRIRHHGGFQPSVARFRSTGFFGGFVSLVSAAPVCMELTRSPILNLLATETPLPLETYRPPGGAVTLLDPHPPAHQRRLSEPHPVYTIGHSTRTVLEFIGLLRIGNVELVVDIRSVPRSRTNPQFNLDVLPEALASWQIGYTHITELGGLRGKSKTVSPEVNGFWNNQSFHNYADYALSGEFRLGLSRLLQLSQHRRCSIMCSEAVWWRCHRRIVADYLLYRGTTVFHLMGRTRVELAKLNEAAIESGDVLVYPVSRFE